MNPTEKQILDTQQFYNFDQPDIVEKDWYVVDALRAASKVDLRPFRLVFTGGTCLARAHKVLQRMSEDVDLKLVCDNPGELSRNKLKGALHDARDRITDALQAAGFPLSRDAGNISSRNEYKYTEYRLPFGAGMTAQASLRPEILLELTYSNVRLPTVMKPVASFVSEAHKRPSEIDAIECTCLAESAAEKLIALTRRIAMEAAGVAPAVDATLIRHVYDLHMLKDKIDTAQVIPLAAKVALSDGQMAKNRHPAYLSHMTRETLNAVAILNNTPVHRENYQKFMDEMVYGEKPSFDQAMQTVSDLANKLCGEVRKHVKSQTHSPKL